MRKTRFTGKIRTDPWESLAVGAREVMDSLWQEYLTELLGGSLKNERRRLIQKEIETQAGYNELYQAWNELPPEERASRWRRLVQTARSRSEVLARECVRCGECCQKGAPSLMVADFRLFQQGLLSSKDVYPLRPGEGEIGKDGRPVLVKSERLKIREIPGSRQCRFYQAATRACRIYEHRPELCRRYFCFQTLESPPEDHGEFLTREHLLAGAEEIRDLVAAHGARCDLLRLRASLGKGDAGQEEAREFLFEALHFDHYLREMLGREWGLAQEEIEFLLGRPLTRFLKDLGIRATLTPEGVFRLTPLSER